MLKTIEAMRATARADDDHDAKCCATEEGRRAFELRQRAHQAARMGFEHAAVALLQQAVACFPPDTDSVGRAAAMHDLATALDVPVTHPASAVAVRDLLEQALASPARQRYPHRWANTARMLAKALRAASQRETDPKSAALLLDRAEGLLRRAIDLAEEWCAWFDAADYWFNLGNLLGERAGLAEALPAYQRALECTRLIDNLEEFVERPTLPRILVALARAVRERGRAGDRKRSRSLIDRAIKLGHPESQVARHVLAQWHLEEGKVDRARQVLQGVDLRAFGLERLEGVIASFEQAGMVDDAIARLRTVLEDLFVERSTTIADVRTDVAAARLQDCAGLLARLLVRHGRALDAFLVLDSVSALRFGEASQSYALRPRDPIARGLWQEFSRHGTTAAQLEELLEQLQFVAPDDWAQAVAGWLREMDELDHPDAHVFDDTRAAVRGAMLDNRVRLEALAREYEAAALRARRARHALAERDPAFSLSAGPFQRDLSVDELQGLFALDTVLIRLDLTPDGHISVIAVERDGEGPRARYARLDVPPGLFEGLTRYARGGKREALAPALTAGLAGLDLSSVLGDRRYAQAVVLPGAEVARLPLAAIGPPGYRLLDRCDEVVWLPSLIALRTRQAPHPPRAGTMTFAPRTFGGTRWHELALRNAMPGERLIIDRATTVEHVLRMARKADVVAFYAHGRHIDGRQALRRADGRAGPSLEMADGELLPLSALTMAWEGAERIELWGCESGVQLPVHPLGVLVDEAYGFDYEFLRMGARSAIGSLYEVLELATAVMLDHYRGRVAEGVRAPRALADAQRYWITTAIPELLALQEADPDRWQERYAETRGIAAPTGSTLTPEACRRLFPCPLVWAAFRFVGVCERRPVDAWDATWDGPLTESEQQTVAALLARTSGAAADDD